MRVIEFTTNDKVSENTIPQVKWNYNTAAESTPLEVLSVSNASQEFYDALTIKSINATNISKPMTTNATIDGNNPIMRFGFNVMTIGTAAVFV